jgi:PPK2 family polyphosphate:nucleotide phosphotransferase
VNIERYRVRPGDRAMLTRIRPDDTTGLEDKVRARKQLEKSIERLHVRQEMLYAQGTYSLLLIFQGMDASGKDSAISNVMSGVNPLGTDVHAFKQPSREELSHDYLWRAAKVLPARGRIGLFNRSYYEDVVVVRVNPELLSGAKLPAKRVGPRLWIERFEDIRAFERHLARNGTVIRKFFLHVSRGKQRERLLERLDNPMKHWKFSAGDLPERAKWPTYMAAYREALAATSSPQAPWYVIPADRKWFAHALIADIVVRTLDGLDLKLPTLSDATRRDLAKARRQLARE